MTVAEEVYTPATEEFAPLPRAETMTPVAETTLPEASVVEGEYTAVMRASSSSSQSPQETDPICLVLTGAEVQGSTIPEAVPVEGIVPEAEVATEAATEPMEIAAPGVAEGVCSDALPEENLEVVVRSPEIQDAEPIRSAPMSEATTTSRDGLELLADDLISPAAVARNLESMRQAEQWMKVRDCTLEFQQNEYPSNCCLLQDVVERSRQKSEMLQGYGDTVPRAETLEKELAKAKKHSAMLQSKLDGAFAQYHNEVQDMQAKSDELVRKNKLLR
jgi:uncharacterized membrane protein